MIELFDGFYINVDRHSYTLAKRYWYNAKDGDRKECSETIGHYTSLADALNGFIRYLVRNELKNGRRTLTEAVATISGIEERVTKFIEENLPKNS